MLKYLFLVILLSYQGALAETSAFKQNAVVSGDNLISIMRKHGFTENQREEILSANRDLRQLFLTLDTKYLSRTQNGLTELRVYDSQTPVAFRLWRKNKAAGAEPIKELKTSLLRVDGKLHGSLMGNILAKVRSNWIASRFLDAYIFDLQPRNLARGAKFWFTVEKKYDQGQFVKYGEITQTSLEVDGKNVVKNFVRAEDGGVFITDQDLLSSKPFYAPVNYLRVASMFQPNRRHPITRRLQPHLGVDFELPAGEKVYAAKKGIVARMGRNHAAGNFIVIQHPGGIETSYNHMSKVQPGVRTGMTVQAGATIGEVGCTGYCTRAHLHFAIRLHGRMVDPLKYTKAFPSNMEDLLQKRVARN